VGGGGGLDVPAGAAVGNGPAVAGCGAVGVRVGSVDASITIRFNNTQINGQVINMISTFTKLFVIFYSLNEIAAFHLKMSLVLLRIYATRYLHKIHFEMA
jgi:hypothetical protein